MHLRFETASPILFLRSKSCQANQPPPRAQQGAIQELLDAMDAFSGPHPGFRPVHAKGAFCAGTFTPSPVAAKLTRAPHVARSSVPAIVRFSDSAGVPTVADNDPQIASPRRIAVRFYLSEHVHTDIIGHSHNGFPVRTGDEFLELERAVAKLMKGDPSAIGAFLASHPRAKEFVEAPKPFPTSLAREKFFAITAFRFTNAAGESRFGRFRIRPQAGTEYLSAADAAGKSANYLMDEVPQRLAQGPIKFGIYVQLADSGDEVDNATTVWPDSRTEVEFGTLALTGRRDAADPEMRKIIFDPVPRVNGIDPSPDPLIELRGRSIWQAAGGDGRRARNRGATERAGRQRMRAARE